MNHSDSPAPSRLLLPLMLPERLCLPPLDGRLRRGLYIDVETTGLDPQADAVIELGLLPFTYSLDGRVVEVLRPAAQTHRNDPGRPLPPVIVALTGLTDDDVRGCSVDVAAATALVETADLVVAHNAGFDRPFVERLLPAARHVPWACSQREVPWTEAGFASASLHCLACAYGAFAADRHRALADCEVGVWLLASRLPHTGEPVLAALRERALKPTVRLWAVRSPFEARGVLKARGYRWMPHDSGGIAKSWWTEVAPDDVDTEIDWLAQHAYRAFGVAAPPTDAIPRRPITAVERWRPELPDDDGHAGAGPQRGRPLH